MYEKHIFPDGSKIFNRLTNQYVSDSDETYQAWINETELVYEYTTEQREVPIIVVNPETGEETTTTEMQDVTVAVPVMNEEGVQETRPVHTLKELGIGLVESDEIPIPSTEEQLAALVEIVTGGV